MSNSNDIHINKKISLTLEEMFKGVNKNIVYERRETCKACRSVISKCHECNGKGFTQVKNECQLNLPPGIGSGMTATKKGLGHSISEPQNLTNIIKGIFSPKKNYGNLNIEIQSLTHQFFTREGQDLVYQLQISKSNNPQELVEEIPYIDGTTLKIQIPPKSNDKNILRIPGKGFPKLGSQEAGHLLIVINLI